MKYLITGANGFVGRNLRAHLAAQKDVEVLAYDLDRTPADLAAWAKDCDGVFHLAGVNRPPSVEEFEKGNAGFTAELCQVLEAASRRVPVIMTSSIQAALENPYGLSKRHAEQALADFGRQSGAPVAIYRLKNVFGKWCRPNYNSVTATFCHNIAHDLPIQISDARHVVNLVYIDDVIAALLGRMAKLLAGDRAEIAPATSLVEANDIPSCEITLGDLAGRLQSFRQMQENLVAPDFSIRFNQQLYATFLSYLPAERLEYRLKCHADQRGNLAEIIKSPFFGQMFVSRSHPGITRGNHYHHTKTEKFMVIAGEAVIRMRHIESTTVQEFPVKGENYQVIEIAPGYTHSITNVGQSELITLFWSSEMFNPDRPDTYFLAV